MKETLLIPAVYEGSRDLQDRSKKLIFSTKEVTPEQAASLQVMVQQYVYLAIKMEDFTKEEINIMTDLKSDYADIGKSPSQRLRAVFYRLWESNAEGYADFNLYYAYRMDQLINHFKAKLP